MSKKVVLDALRSPSLVGELKKYHTRLSNTVAKRGLLAILSGIFLLLQYVVLFFPSYNANIANIASDSIYGGFTSKQDALLRYDSSGSVFNDNLEAFAITRAELAQTTEATLDQWVTTESPLLIAWSQSPVYKLDFEERGASVRSYFLARNNKNDKLFYGHVVENSPSSAGHGTEILQGYSQRSGRFAILKNSGNVLTNNFNTDTCYKQPNDSLSYIHCPNSGSLKTETKVTNVSYNTDAEFLKNRPGDRLQYSVKIKNQGYENIILRPQIYLGDILEYSKLTGTFEAQFVKKSKTLQWPQVTLAPNKERAYIFTVEVLDNIPLSGKGLTNATSQDCYMTSFFGGQTNIKIYCPTPKVIENMLARPMNGYFLALVWSIFLVNTLLYARAYVLSKEHAFILKTARRKHV